MKLINQTEIKEIVKQVLSDLMTNESPLPKIETPEKINPKRKLADENIARWLGNESQTKKIHTPKNIPKIAAGKEVTTEDRNLIPNPRRPEKLDEMLKATPARVGVWRTGTRYLTKVALKLRADHAVAKDAVYAEPPADFAQKNNWVPLTTKAKNKEEFLLRPDLGRVLDDASLALVKEKSIKNPDIQITVADGLSSWASERYALAMTNELKKLCAQENYSVGTIFFVKYSRIAIQDVIGETVGAKISMILLGERPGLGTGDSLSNYIAYDPKMGMVNAKKSMISNIHPAGYKPEEAAALTIFMVKKMFEQKCSGVDLKI